MADFGTGGQGPYPRQWGEHEIRFWDSEPNTYRELYNPVEWADLQEAFGYGWLYFVDDDGRRLTKDEHDEARERFYDISGTQASSFDWAGFREYLDNVETT